MKGIRIVNIEPPECPEILTTQEAELIRMMRGLSPERFKVFKEMVDIAYEMYSEGYESSDIIRYLERNFGGMIDG